MVKAGWWRSGFGTPKEVLDEYEWPYYLDRRLTEVQLSDRRMHGEHESLGVELRELWEVLRRFDLPGLDVDAFRDALCKMAAQRTRRERRWVG